MKGKVPRAIARREGDGWHFRRRKLAVLWIKFPNEDSVETQVDVQHEPSGRTRLDHVRVSSIVAAECERTLWCVRCLGRANLSGILVYVCRSAEAAAVQNWKYSHGAAEVICDQ